MTAQVDGCRIIVVAGWELDGVGGLRRPAKNVTGLLLIVVEYVTERRPFEPPPKLALPNIVSGIGLANRLPLCSTCIVDISTHQYSTETKAGRGHSPGFLASFDFGGSKDKGRGEGGRITTLVLARGRIKSPRGRVNIHHPRSFGARLTLLFLEL